MKTSELLERLQRHYIKPGAVPAGGIFLPEVGWNGGGTSRADALYVGFTSTSGQMLVGHELKVSRSDWLAELSSPGKADQWAENCHEWWLVTLPGVVRDGELPPGWGLMVPGRSKTRMAVIQPAPRRLDVRPSWDATRSIMARLDTLQSVQLREVRAEAAQTIVTETAKRVEAALQVKKMAEPDTEALRELVMRYETALGALGARLVPWTPDCKPPVTDEQLAAMSMLLAHSSSVEHAARRLGDRWQRRVLGDIGDAVKTLDDLLAKYETDAEALSTF